VAHVILAPVLQDVALRMSPGGADPRTDPAAFAYVLRDAVQLARPDWIVTHHDLALEADAVAAEGVAADDVVDVDLGATALGAGALDLTATLRGVFPGATIAASITGPATMARALLRTADGTDAADLAADCGDVLAALAATHAERGADHVIVWEPETAGLGPVDLAPAHEPILRRLALAGADGVLCHPTALGLGYAAMAGRHHGTGAVLLSPEAFASPDALTTELAHAAGLAGEAGIALSDGPVPGDCDLAALRQLGER
jgi:hypothetical protein